MRACIALVPEQLQCQPRERAERVRRSRAVTEHSGLPTARCGGCNRALAVAAAERSCAVPSAARALLCRPHMWISNKRLCRDQRGQILIEYLAVMFIVGLGLVAVVGPEVGPRVVTEYARRIALLYSTYP